MKNEENSFRGRSGLFLCAGMVLLWALGGLFCEATFAAPVSSGQAHKLVEGWLKNDARPLASRLGNQLESVETYNDEQGQPLYYVVYLRPNGFAIVPAEDLVEPVVCFSSGGVFNPSDDNPLGAMVSRDLPGRINAARAVDAKRRLGWMASALTEQESAVRDSSQKAFGKWSKLLADNDNPPIGTLGLGSVSDVRVAPLLQTRWGQTTCCYSPALACFNYFTPPYEESNSSNYPSGCVATAMAQYMKFWQYPTAGVGTPCFTIYIDGSPTTRCLRGGDGYGGAYNWNQMVLDLDCSTTLDQRKAIGALVYDAGVAVNMQYASGSSGAFMSYCDSAMTSTFDYSNSIYGYNNNNNIGAGLNAMINPNLDYGNPVILGIQGPVGGHAVVADGYGYQSSTLYHHLNLGWDGTSDAWYNLPNINSSPYSFNVVDSAIYNIYITGSGEIISGRITAFGSGSPLSGATVTATRSGGGTYISTTNSNGIYAVAKVQSNSNYTVSVTKTGYSFTSAAISTGRSQDNQATSGNKWGIDFIGTPSDPSPPVAYDSNLSVEKGVALPITLQVTDDYLPNPPGDITYIITSLPEYGTLSDPYAGQIDNVPYVLVNNGNSVVYTSVMCYSGADSFQFKANDGGTPPSGGDSNIATVSVNIVLPSPEVVYETHFDTGLPAGWTISDGGSSTDTWNSDNPAGRSSSGNWTGVFMIVDSDWAGYEDMDEQLITHSIDCTNLSDVKLRFKHDFYYNSYEIGDVDIRVNGGVWQNLARYEGADYYGLVEFSLSSFGADGAADVQIRWHYYNAYYEWYWGIDDVQIIAVVTGDTLSVGDFERDCDVDNYDLDVFASAWLSGPEDPSFNPDCDISQPADGFIDLLDFSVFAGDWLSGVE